MKTKLQIKDLGIKLGEITIVKDLNLSIKENEFVSIFGPSGCGKTTLLNAIAKFITKTDGEIVLDGRRIGFVFQDHNLFPWKTVAGNIGFGLRMKKIPKKRIQKKVKEYIRLFRLEGFENYYPHQLSGGMQQRVGIARTLITDPDVILMDEPFGALDKQMRQKMQEFLLKILEKKKKTIIFVTHDIDEGIFLSDRVIVLSERPARIVKEVKIDLSRPRTFKMTLSQNFLKIKKKFI